MVLVPEEKWARGLPENTASLRRPRTPDIEHGGRIRKWENSSGLGFDHCTIEQHRALVEVGSKSILSRCAAFQYPASPTLWGRRSRHLDVPWIMFKLLSSTRPLTPDGGVGVITGRDRSTAEGPAECEK